MWNRVCRRFGRKGIAGCASHTPHGDDAILLRLPGTDEWILRDSFAGTIVFGETGSGKTTGSGAAIAKSFLSRGMGGLVLTAKVDERARWEQWCRQAGRSDDVIVFGTNRGHRFNWLDHLLNSSTEGAGLTQNLVHAFRAVSEAHKRHSHRGGGGGDDSYWNNATDAMIANAIEIVSLATGTVTLEGIHEVIQSAPQSREQVFDEKWEQSSTCMQYIAAAMGRAVSEAKANDRKIACIYWLKEFPSWSDRTRSIAVNMFSGMADGLLRSPMRELFSGATTVSPEDTFAGKIWIIDLPIKAFDVVGTCAQVLIKYLWQKAVERRSLEQFPRPVFLWADEAQSFITQGDTEYQATARASRASTVFLTQSMSSLLSALGGESARPAVLSLLGNLTTKIFHANSNADTNTYASDLIGKSSQFRGSSGMSFGQPGAAQQNAGMNEQIDYEIQPREFTSLAKGGPDNKWCVEAIFYQGGRRFRATGKTWVRVGFQQETRR